MLRGKNLILLLKSYGLKRAKDWKKKSLTYLTRDIKDEKLMTVSKDAGKRRDGGVEAINEWRHKYNHNKKENHVWQQI